MANPHALTGLSAKRSEIAGQIQQPLRQLVSRKWVRGRPKIAPPLGERGAYIVEAGNRASLAPVDTPQESAPGLPSRVRCL